MSSHMPNIIPMWIRYSSEVGCQPGSSHETPNWLFLIVVRPESWFIPPDLSVRASTVILTTLWVIPLKMCIWKRRVVSVVVRQWMIMFFQHRPMDYLGTSSTVWMSPVTYGVSIRCDYGTSKICNLVNRTKEKSSSLSRMLANLLFPHNGHKFPTFLQGASTPIFQFVHKPHRV